MMISKSTAFTSVRPSRATLQVTYPASKLRVKAVEEKGTSTPTPDAPSTSGQPSTPADSTSAQFRREFRSLGSQVIEQDAPFEEPPPKDMWDTENFEVFGQVLEKWFLPGLVVLGLICGGYAASTYNEDADTFIKPAAGPDVPVEVVPASALNKPAPSVAAE